MWIVILLELNYGHWILFFLVDFDSKIFFLGETISLVNMLSCQMLTKYPFLFRNASFLHLLSETYYMLVIKLNFYGHFMDAWRLVAINGHLAFLMHHSFIEFNSAYLTQFQVFRKLKIQIFGSMICIFFFFHN